MRSWHAEDYLKISRRMGTSFLLFYMEIDGLKQINDAFGHEEGSLAIIRVARALKETFREWDVEWHVQLDDAQEPNPSKCYGKPVVLLISPRTFSSAENSSLPKTVHERVG